MVLRATPVARAVAATPPWPALCASAATCNRPARSSSDGRTASNRSAMGFSSIIPPPYRDHGAARITQPLEAPTDALISGRRLSQKGASRRNFRSQVACKGTYYAENGPSQRDAYRRSVGCAFPQLKVGLRVHFTVRGRLERHIPHSDSRGCSMTVPARPDAGQLARAAGLRARDLGGPVQRPGARLV